MNVYRDGKRYAHWPISTGRPGDDTPNGTYLSIEKGNPVEMVGEGYDLQVPYSVRITWSGVYLHAASWSVGSQGSTNVSHGCINMSPDAAAIYYAMSIPGDPVTVTGSSRAGTFDNGWTMWFKSWRAVAARQRPAPGRPRRPARQQLRELLTVSRAGASATSRSRSRPKERRGPAGFG